MDDSGRILFVYINTDWSNANKEYSVPIPFMDGDMTALEIKEYCKAKKYIISLQPPTILW
jgi:YbbR domain-containing protein